MACAAPICAASSTSSCSAGTAAATPQRPSTPCSASARASDPPTTATSSDNASDPGRPGASHRPPSDPPQLEPNTGPPACLTAIETNFPKSKSSRTSPGTVRKPCLERSRTINIWCDRKQREKPLTAFTSITSRTRKRASAQRSRGCAKCLKTTTGTSRRPWQGNARARASGCARSASPACSTIRRSSGSCGNSAPSAKPKGSSRTRAGIGACESSSHQYQTLTNIFRVPSLESRRKAGTRSGRRGAMTVRIELRVVEFAICAALSSDAQPLAVVHQRAQRLALARRPRGETFQTTLSESVRGFAPGGNSPPDGRPSLGVLVHPGGTFPNGDPN